jgi:hypothetical protein
MSIVMVDAVRTGGANNVLEGSGALWAFEVVGATHPALGGFGPSGAPRLALRALPPLAFGL